MTKFYSKAYHGAQRKVGKWKREFRKEINDEWCEWAKKFKRKTALPNLLEEFIWVLLRSKHRINNYIEYGKDFLTPDFIKRLKGINESVMEAIKQLDLEARVWEIEHNERNQMSEEESKMIDEFNERESKG